MVVTAAPGREPADWARRIARHAMGLRLCRKQGAGGGTVGYVRSQIDIEKTDRLYRNLKDW